MLYGGYFSDMFESESEENEYLFLNSKDVATMIKNDFRDIPPFIESKLIDCCLKEIPIPVAYNKLSYLSFYYHGHKFKVSKNFVYSYYLYYRKKGQVRDYITDFMLDLVINEMN